MQPFGTCQIAVSTIDDEGSGPFEGGRKIPRRASRTQIETVVFLCLLVSLSPGEPHLNHWMRLVGGREGNRLMP